jgi:hypothetical protein
MSARIPISGAVRAAPAAAIRALKLAPYAGAAANPSAIKAQSRHKKKFTIFLPTSRIPKCISHHMLLFSPIR